MIPQIPLLLRQSPEGAAVLCFLMVFMVAVLIALFATWMLSIKENRELQEQRRLGVERLQQADPAGREIARRMIDGKPFPRGKQMGGRGGYI